MGIENRRDPRAPLALRVQYRHLNTFLADYTRDLSKGGTFIRTTSPLPAGTRFVLELQVPGFASPVRLEGEVSRSMNSAQAGAAGVEPGMGVRFTFDDEERRAAFEQTVEKTMVDTLGEDIYRGLVARK